MGIVISILSFISLFKNNKKKNFTHLSDFFSKEKTKKKKPAGQPLLAWFSRRNTKAQGGLQSIRSLTWQNYGLVQVFKKAKEIQALSSAIAGTIKAKERNEKEEEEEED